MPRLFALKAAIPEAVRRLAADRRGVVAIVSGFALVVLLGFAGAAIDVGKWLKEQRSIQSAADQAAYSAAAAADTSGCPNAAAEAQARAIAAARGYVDGQDGATVSVACNAGNSTFTVDVSEVQPMWFTRLFLSEPPQVSGSATAQLAGTESDLCILANDGTNFYEGVVGSDSSAFSIGGNTTVDIACGIAVNSSNVAALSTGGSSSLTATSIYLVGDHQGSPSGASQMTTSPTPNNILKYQRPVQDPYAGRTIPTLSSCTATGKIVDTDIPPVPGGVYCGGLTFGTTGGSGNTVTLNPGVYYVVGGSLTFNSKAKVSGEGVTFVLTGNRLGQTGYATVTINGGPQSLVSLTAPTSGPYGGLVFFQDRAAPITDRSSCGSGSGGQNQFSGGSNQLITGAVYFPNQSLCYSGGSSSSGAGKCTQLIAHTLTFTGNSTIRSECAGTGISPISITKPQLIR